jgi:transposase-like protein
MRQPTTLIDAINYFSDPNVCLDFMSKLRWPNGIVICPNCGGSDVTFLESRCVWVCKAKHAKRQFSIKVGTIFEDSPISLSKWLPSVWLIVSAKNGISSYELARSIGVTQKSAWFMLHRIRLAMKGGAFSPMVGEVEVDETFIGGKSRFMHKAERARKIKGTGGMGKTAVLGLLERHGPDGHSAVRAQVVETRRRKTLSPVVREQVEAGTVVYTDALKSYNDLRSDYVHQVIDHAEEYVRGNVHTNGIENFWSLLKRSIKGTYVSVEPFHLHRYFDEQAFRFNTREDADGVRAARVVKATLGRRLTYNALIGAADTP